MKNITLKKNPKRNSKRIGGIVFVLRNTPRTRREDKGKTFISLGELCVLCALASKNKKIPPIQGFYNFALAKRQFSGYTGQNPIFQGKNNGRKKHGYD
jgi:hypothetical protein